MYPKYFGLKEPSFSIAPDPHYLFLSEQHREALAHLLYGAGESGGFVLLTGEVGTGKTTVCRAFLEQLPDGVDVALILNPAQSANELLTNVCEEFRIPLPEGKRSNKMLIDRLNQYLLSAHANGRRPLLIIDEAQNLLPRAMEQIRLLTNLETTKQKLLQIFLIGQPELRQMLERDRLRQLNQRITARFHLMPFTPRETSDYIRHRVAVAGVDRPLFSARAIRRIYRYSSGVPRLINILCDRALLGTCVTRGSQVTPAIVAKAAREVRGGPLDAPTRFSWHLALLVLASFGLAVAAGLWAHSRLDVDPGELLSRWFQAETRAPQASESPEATSARVTQSDVSAVPALPVAESGDALDPSRGPVSAVAPTPGSEDAAEPIPMADVEGGVPEGGLERLAMPAGDAMRVLLRRWGLELKAVSAADPCDSIRLLGLGCEREQGQLSHVRYFNLPALLRVEHADGASRFLALGALDAIQATLDLPEGRERVPLASLESLWTGEYTLVWQLPPGGATVVGVGSQGEDVRWLRDLLRQVPGLAVPPGDSSRFDADLAAAVRAFQASKGLAPDGVAGPRTFIALQQAVELPGVPRLATDPAGAAAAEQAP